jgi:hypothetical protein
VVRNAEDMDWQGIDEKDPGERYTVEWGRVVPITRKLS